MSNLTPDELAAVALDRDDCVVLLVLIGGDEAVGRRSNVDRR
jgi:hypothetical protein